MRLSPRRLAALAGSALVLTALVAAGGAGSAAAKVAPASVPQADPHVDTRERAAAWHASATPVVNAGAWCGPISSADDTVHEVPQAGPKFHLVIAYPSDVAADAPRLADDGFARIKTLEAFYAQRVGVSGVGTGSALGWKVRFDYGTAGCLGNANGALYPDISFYRLPHPASYYPSDTPPYSQVTGDLAASGLYSASNKRYLVHFVGSGGSACGQSYIYAPGDNAGGARYSVIYYFNEQGVSECTWETDAHEMGHSMGAATGGPQVLDGAHTWDCYNDVMSYANVATVAAHCGDQALYYDYGNDNYFNHGGGWNDTKFSGFWCKPNC